MNKDVRDRSVPSGAKPYDSIKAELLDDLDVRVAYNESMLRRSLAEVLENRRATRGLTIRELARLMNTSKSQVQRVLNEESGGSLTTRTMVRAAEVLGVKLRLYARDASVQDSTVHVLKPVTWSYCPARNCSDRGEGTGAWKTAEAGS